MSTEPNNVPKKWPTKTVNFDVITNNAPSWWSLAVAFAATYFNQNPAGVRIQVTPKTYAYNQLPGMYNGRSEIYWTNNPVNGGVADAYPYAPESIYQFNTSTCFIQEADIRYPINNPPLWTTSLNASNLKIYGGLYRSIYPSLIHEMGHAVGLAHENNYYNIMGIDADHVHKNGTLIEPYLGEDASAGLVSLYGLSSNPPANSQDVSLSHWRYFGAIDEYSAHTRTPLYNTSGQYLPYNTYGGEPYYQVKRGQTIKFPLNFENNGRSTQYNVPISYYLSTYSGADEITTSDTLMLSSYVSLAPDQPNYLENTVTIPCNAATGFYRLGAIINPQNTTPSNEFDTRNASYVGIQVINP